MKDVSKTSWKRRDEVWNWTGGIRKAQLLPIGMLAATDPKYFEVNCDDDSYLIEYCEGVDDGSDLDDFGMRREGDTDQIFCFDHRPGLDVDFFQHRMTE